MRDKLDMEHLVSSLGLATRETDISHFCYYVIISLIIIEFMIIRNKLTVKYVLFIITSIIMEVWLNYNDAIG